MDEILPFNALDCRANAEECSVLATPLATGARKTLLLGMAQSWLALANQLDRFNALPKSST